MADLIQIANLSLIRIGTRSTIADLEEDSPEARTFKTIYEQARDDTLEAMDWGFARGRRNLADLGSPPNGWAYRYAYPTDAIRLRSIYNPVKDRLHNPIFNHFRHDDLNSAPVPAIPYEIAASKDGQGNDIRVIYTNMELAEAIYTRRITNTNLFPPGFVVALSWACGAQMAIPLTGDKGTLQNCMTIWREAIGEAAAADANESPQQQNTLPDWITNR